jgi:hypothetical protein
MPAEKTEYKNLRDNLNDKYTQMSDERLESLLQKQGIDAEAMEGFFDQLGKFASTAGQAVLKAAPSILPVAGTVLGTAFGGPLAASLGGSLGSLAGKAIGGATGQAPSMGASGAGGVAGLLGSPAASQLLQTVVKPETLQALTSMAMGPLGKPNVDVGGTSVPVAAFGNLLKMLAGRTEAEYYESIAASREAVPAYMQDYAGLPKGDPAVAAHRAAALFELLDSTEADDEADDERSEEAEAEAETFESEMVELEEAYEELEEAYDSFELEEAYDSFELEEAYDSFELEEAYESED